MLTHSAFYSKAEYYTYTRISFIINIIIYIEERKRTALLLIQKFVTFNKGTYAKNICFDTLIFVRCVLYSQL